MAILISQNILDRIRDELSRSKESFTLISAYCKLQPIKYFDSCIACDDIEKKLLVRFRPDDLFMGASDLELYPYCKEHGWSLYFRLDLHAKTYVFDHLRCIVGSANATKSGLNMGGVGNYEMATAFELTEKDVDLLRLLIQGAVEMTDDIYNTMREILSDSHGQITNVSEWPDEIMDLFKEDYSLLFAEDFPTCCHPGIATNEDMMFLHLSAGSSREEIKREFAKSKCYRWLLKLIKEQPEQEMYFGSITKELHDTLLDEPKPYRKDVKQLLSNLLAWISDLNMEELIVDVPQHSQRVRYMRCDNG